MNIFKSTFIITGLTLVFIGCSPLKQIETAKTNALSSYNNNQYQEAYTQLSALIEKYKQSNIDVPYDVYLKTAESATKLENHAGASNYYAMALDDSLSVPVLKNYVSSLSKSAEYSKVSEVLSENEKFLNKSGEEEFIVSTKFNVAEKKSLHKDILELYPKLKETNEAQSMSYLVSLEQFGRKTEAAGFCNKLVKEHPEYLKAKEWKAIYHYNLAEKWYKSEMDKYNKDKNYTAYVYLKRELKKISANYRVSKNIFEELHKKYPEEKKYIRYLKNTYIRLEMKKEAAAMDKLLK
ncbi:hypothetical protein E9993_11840 [Labilibacter sediminis]|nr:hypothetical protein E9993_11840 [Labilibacter sediminis]